MSEIENPVGPATEFAQGVLGQVNRILEQAARTDEAGKWGIDGWVTMFHNLIDLQIRTSASVLQIAMGGPWWLRPPNRDVPLSEPITVPPENFPRAIWIAKSFTRLGQTSTVIPDRVITFEPPVLAANQTTFQIDLTNDDYSGANYCGEISLRPVGASHGASSPAIPVTVGL